MKNSAAHTTNCGGAHYKKCLMIIKTNPVVTRTDLCGPPPRLSKICYNNGVKRRNNLNPTMKEFSLLRLYTTAVAAGANKGLWPGLSFSQLEKWFKPH